MKIDLDKSREFLRRLRIREKARRVRNPIGFMTQGEHETQENVRRISERATFIR